MQKCIERRRLKEEVKMRERLDRELREGERAVVREIVREGIERHDRSCDGMSA